MFEVDSDEPLTRWSTAVMTSYDGVVWTVADPDDAVHRLPAGQLAAADARRATGLRPDGGRRPSRSLDCDGPVAPGTGRGDERRVRRRLGHRSGAVPAPMRGEPGVEHGGRTDGCRRRHGLHGRPRSHRRTPTDDELREPSVGRGVGGRRPRRAAASDPQPRRRRDRGHRPRLGPGGGDPRPVPQRRASTTRAPGCRPVTRTTGSAQFLADPEQIVGYEEQYAAAAALIAQDRRTPGAGRRRLRDRAGALRRRARPRCVPAMRRRGSRCGSTSRLGAGVGQPAAQSRARRRERGRRRGPGRDAEPAPAAAGAARRRRVHRERGGSRSRSRRKRRRTRTSPTRRPEGAASALWAGWRSAAGASLFVVLAACGAIIVWKRRRTRQTARSGRPGGADRWCMARTHRPLRGGRRRPRPTWRHRSKRCVRWRRSTPPPRPRRTNWSDSPGRSIVPPTTGSARRPRPPTSPGAILTRPWTRCSPTSRSPAAPACGSIPGPCDDRDPLAGVATHRPTNPLPRTTNRKTRRRTDDLPDGPTRSRPTSIPSWVAGIRAGARPQRAPAPSPRRAEPTTPSRSTGSRSTPGAIGRASSRRGIPRRRSASPTGLLERIRQEIGARPRPSRPPCPHRPDCRRRLLHRPPPTARRPPRPTPTGPYHRRDPVTTPAYRASSNWPRPRCGGSHVSVSPPLRPSPRLRSSPRRHTTGSTGRRS